MVPLLLVLPLLTFLLASWWGMRSDTLFGTGRWLAGKDTGKYVFYTYDFLFRPLGSGVTLTGDMGFQEILLAEPEGPGRELDGLSASVWVETDGYLWTELHREGEECLAFRLSRKKGHPGGWARFGPAGRLLEEQPWSGEGPRIEDRWHLLEARLEGDSWRVTVDGTPVGRVPDAGPRRGRLGFRGSGPLGGRVLVRDVSTSWFDQAGGRRWTEHDRLSAGRIARGTWGGAAAVALVFLFMRYLARASLLAEVDPGRRRRAAAAGDVALAACLLAATLLPPFPAGLAIPGALLAASLADIGLLGWAGGGTGTGQPPSRREAPVALLLGLLVVAAGWGLLLHGPLLLRGNLPGPPILRGVHPDAYRLTPPDDGAAVEYALESQVTVAPGKPLLTGERLFGDQVVEFEADLPPRGALDLVFQLRSFVTAGDRQGEEIPFGRRLLRLSADPRVPGGLSKVTGSRPAPFRHPARKPRAGPARVRVVADGRGVTATVNGVVTEFPGVGSLGRGETGLLAWGGPVTVRSFRVRPLGGSGKGARGRGTIAFFLALVLVPAALLGWRLLRPRNDSPRLAALLLGSAFPAGLYLAGALVLSTGDLAFLGRDRLVWLDLLLLASLLQAAGAVLLLRGRLRFAAAAFNLLLAVSLGAALLTGWDLLPANHPLRLRYAGEAEAPAAAGRGKARQGRPWYADMNSIGASTFVWKQALGGEAISADKPAGEVRVMVVGGSQAWGSGAASSAQTFAELLEQRLRDRGLPARVWNAGVNGAGTSQVAATCLGLLRDFRPDVIVADIGLNDSSALHRARDREVRSRRIAASFAELAAACRADGVDLLLVPEPMSRETALRPLKEHYAALEEIARGAGFGVADPGRLFVEEERRGMVWWDTAHLTPRGQHLMAAFLEEPVARLVARKAGGEQRSGVDVGNIRPGRIDGEEP